MPPGAAPHRELATGRRRLAAWGPILELENGQARPAPLGGKETGPSGGAHSNRDPRPNLAGGNHGSPRKS
jgi:hypothetical protein